MKRFRVGLGTLLVAMGLLASAAGAATGGTPFWILEQNHRAAEQAARRPSAPIVSHPVPTATIAVPTPRQLDPG